MSLLPNQSQEPSHHPVRTNTHFTLSFQHSHQHQQEQQYKDEHEMTSLRNPNQANSSNNNIKKLFPKRSFGDIAMTKPNKRRRMILIAMKMMVKVLRFVKFKDTTECKESDHRHAYCTALR
ncbi:uncharacterized protein MELLADRAFT_111144 [Melampsora larici-populina 98AG31]|uniref:Uncharacterized protein n=1 Tax=Melampsora larici-populina (strain 98AG31 / pathotype 3-4-7) TaxID=747676 RepID=F4S262_MELLP|nr:uncharacterized protein MELLADRAFT_111144 [Melampsora larici-populina 98AG31]EGG01312.1 hypothetical protein MELLADRAFT_111144 [Melampsora larici-populina 98AG31]